MNVSIREKRPTELAGYCVCGARLYWSPDDEQGWPVGGDEDCRHESEDMVSEARPLVHVGTMPAQAGE